MAGVAAHSRPSPLATAAAAVTGWAAPAAGWLTGRLLMTLPTVPGLAGSAMASYGAALIYRPAGFIAGGAFLLWLGTELNRRRTELNRRRT